MIVAPNIDGFEPSIVLDLKNWAV